MGGRRTNFKDKNCQMEGRRTIFKDKNCQMGGRRTISKDEKCQMEGRRTISKDEKYQMEGRRTIFLPQEGVTAGGGKAGANNKTGSNTQKKPSKAQKAPWTAVCSCYCMRKEKNGL